MTTARLHSAGAIVVLWLGGCGQPAGEIFPAISPPVVFPAPPDAPRIAYVGALSTDRDLKPAVSGWQSLARAVSGPPQPQSVSAPAGLFVTEDDRLLVTDPPRRSLHIFDLQQRRYRVVTEAGPAPLIAPADVAVADGRVFVTDAGRSAIDVFNLDGVHQTSWTSLNLARPVGLAFELSTRRLYVVDSARHECVAFDLEGREQLRFGGRGSEPGKLNFPTFVCADARHGVAIADSMNARVQRFTLDGQFIAAVGRKGDGAGDFSLPKGVAFDQRGHLHVADAQFENVQTFDAEGRLLMAFGREGQGPGEFWLPSKLFIDSRQRLWVADSYNRRVQVFRILPEPTP